MNKARLITTLKCARHCEGCCNTPAMINSAIVIDSIRELKEFDEINVTGGEPMMFPEKLLRLLKHANKLKKHPVIYLYMSICNPVFDHAIINLVDGIHYTIHSPCSESDINMFANYQEFLVKEGATISKRLHIFPDVNVSIPIRLNFWDNINFKPWLKDAPLPENETLFILKRGIDNEK